MTLRIGGSSLDIETRDPAAGAPLPQLPSQQLPHHSPEQSRAASARPQSVIISGIDVPFGDLVWLLLKIFVAAIPAVLLFSGIALVLVFSGLLSVASIPR